MRCKSWKWKDSEGIEHDSLVCEGGFSYFKWLWLGNMFQSFIAYKQYDMANDIIWSGFKAGSFRVTWRHNVPVGDKRLLVC